MCKEKYAKEIDSQAFPGIQGGPLMHVIAAKAVCFQEALQPAFKNYQAADRATMRRALAEGMKRNGFRLVSGGTDNHLMLVDVGAQGLDRQGMPDRAGRSGHHGQQEHDSVRNALAVPGQRHPAGHAGGDDSRHERSRKWPRLPT